MQIVRLDRWRTSVETQAEIRMTKRRVKICDVSGGGGEKVRRSFLKCFDVRYLCGVLMKVFTWAGNAFVQEDWFSKSRFNR